MRKLLEASVCIALTAVAPIVAIAQDWPSRPIKYLMPFQGLPDALARAYNAEVSAALRQPIVPEYKLGVAGRIALTEIARAEPNGYTIGMASSGPLTIQPVLYSQLPFDADKSFAVLNILGTSPMALAVSSSSNVHSLDDLINLSKTRELNIAAGGAGGPHHLAAVLLQKIGVRALVVHYKTSAEMMTAMVSGAIDAYFDTVYQQDAFVKQGRYRAIGVASAQRMPQMPDVPTFAELGHPEIDIQTFYATVAPAATPQPILDRLAAAYKAAGNTPEVKNQLSKMALLPMDKPRKELDAMARDARLRWKRVIEENKITVE